LILGAIIGFFIGCIFTFLLTFKAFTKLEHNNDNSVIKLNNEDECTIEELNDMIWCDDCKICNIYEWADDCDDRCLECQNGNTYISHFKFVGIKEINNKYEIYKEEV
jgi:hypothetical protein